MTKNKIIWTLGKITALVWMPISSIILFIIYRMWVSGDLYDNKNKIASELVFALYWCIFTSSDYDEFDVKVQKKFEKVLSV